MNMNQSHSNSIDSRKHVYTNTYPRTKKTVQDERAKSKMEGRPWTLFVRPLFSSFIRCSVIRARRCNNSGFSKQSVSQTIISQSSHSLNRATRVESR